MQRRADSLGLVFLSVSPCATIDQRVGYDLGKAACSIMGLGVQTRR